MRLWMPSIHTYHPFEATDHNNYALHPHSQISVRCAHKHLVLDRHLSSCGSTPTDPFFHPLHPYLSCFGCNGSIDTILRVANVLWFDPTDPFQPCFASIFGRGWMQPIQLIP
eukprot:1070794_1